MTEPTPNSDTTGIKGRWKKATEGVGQKIAIGWYAFGNIVSFILIILVLLGNSSPSTSKFAITSIDLQPQVNVSETRMEVYRAINYTAINPLNDQLEPPRYLFLSFTGVCHIFDNNSNDTTKYTKQCTKRFVQPLFLPEGTLTNRQGEIRSTSDLRINETQLRGLWTATAAILVVTMAYNVIIIVLLAFGNRTGGWAMNTWPIAIGLTIPTIIMSIYSLSRVLRSLDTHQYPAELMSFDPNGATECYGMLLVFLALGLTFIANPYLLFFVGCIVLIVFIKMFGCCFGCCKGSSDKEAKVKTKTKTKTVYVQDQSWY